MFHCIMSHFIKPHHRIRFIDVIAIVLTSTTIRGYLNLWASKGWQNTWPLFLAQKRTSK